MVKGIVHGELLKSYRLSLMRPAEICATQPLPQREFVAYGKLFVPHFGFAGGGLSDEK